MVFSVQYLLVISPIPKKARKNTKGNCLVTFSLAKRVPPSTLLNPATENRNYLYLILCGVIAVISMILPGISGSFILVLMGNYQLVAIEAINSFDLTILAPVLLGMVIGLIAFSHLLSWLLNTYNNQTLAVLTGFIFGSLGVIWPWKQTIYMLSTEGEPIIKNGKMVVERFILVLPENFGNTEITAILIMISGIVSIWLVEWLAKKK